MPTNRELSDFLLRACHDLRTPLRAVRTHTELLAKKAPVGEDRSLTFIVDGSRQADHLVDAIAAYATALQIDPKSFLPTQLDVAVRGAIAKLQGTVTDLAAEVTYGELPRVQGNPDRLTQLFEQLLRNSFGHRGSEPPRVHIAAERPSEAEWRISVQDNGPGVEATEIDSIFRPFERLRGKSAGMGLATCRAIVEAHGGAIHAESPEGGGLTIVFTLPA